MLSPLGLVLVLVTASLLEGVVSPPRGHDAAMIREFGPPPAPFSLLSELAAHDQVRSSLQEAPPAATRVIEGPAFPGNPEVFPFQPGPGSRSQPLGNQERNRGVEPGAASVTLPPGIPSHLNAQDESFLFSGDAARFETEEATLTVERAPEEQVRSHWVGGEIDAGGPYGGPDTKEGETLTITVTVKDPRVIFLRYDINGDGIFDYPDQTGGGTMGKWTTQTTITKTYYDNFYGDIVVEGWDGVSAKIKIATGTNLGEPSTPQWLLHAPGYTLAWGFHAKEDMEVQQLGHYHYIYNLFEMAIWSVSGIRLGVCTPTHVRIKWNWCTPSEPIQLFAGQDYRITIRIATFGVAINTPTDTSRIDFKGAYYCRSLATPCFPYVHWSNQFIPLIDFRWRQILVLPDATRDTAFLEVNNVAPTVFDLSADVSPAPEGMRLNVIASFDDPGLDDTWEARWRFPDGTDSGWQPVPKTTGGARVLILHAITGAIDALKARLWEDCGTFCLSIDALDFGPVGENRVPTLEELRGYDVIVVTVAWGRIPGPDEVGDRLAEFMDAAGATGGGVIMMAAGFYDNDIFGIGGRWETDKSPLPRAGFAPNTVTLGTIYEVNHPILDGVVSASGGFHHLITNVTVGASRIADWSDNTVFAAAKTDAGGRRAVGLNFNPSPTAGDLARVLTNAIRYASRQPDFTWRTMPFVLDPVSVGFADDHPFTTTHEDELSLRVEVRDDDHGKFEVANWTLIFEETFDDPAECDWTASVAKWPPGWTAQPTHGWRCEATTGRRGPTVFYHYNDPLYGTGDGDSYLFTDAFNLSTFTGIRMEYYHDWRASFPSGDQDGYIQASVDGGATWITLQEYHHNDPSADTGERFFESLALGGHPNVTFRFYYASWDDWWWFLDNVRLFGNSGEIMAGLGTAEGTIQVENVDALASGGFDAADRDTNGDVLFKGFRIEDPALWEPSEWFAYAWDFGDGSEVQWEYKGNMTPPEFDVLLVHSLCLSGNLCSDYRELHDRLLSLDDIDTVDGFNLMNHPGLPQAPDFDLLMAHDVIVIAMNWGYFSYLPWTFARRQLGNRLADYADAGGGGVLTLMTAFDLSPALGDALSLLGRYVDDDYGPFEKELLIVGEAELGSLVDPDHDLFVRVRMEEVSSSLIYSGNYTVTIGGGGQASGRNGSVLARWADGNNAVGVKELANGMRTVHLGLHPRLVGDDTPYLLRNAIGWAAGGIPTPVLSPITHRFGSDPQYTVDLKVIDDDMGWIWDPISQSPIEVIPPAIISHRYITIT